MSANEKQIGGEHYSRLGEYQHWDWVCDIKLPYLEGCATKYLSRWRDKGGLQDILKSTHYMEKAKELFKRGIHSNTCIVNSGFEVDRLNFEKRTNRFFDSLPDNVTFCEKEIIESIAEWRHAADIDLCIVKLIRLHDDAATVGVPGWPSPTGAAFKAPSAPPAEGSRQRPDATGHPAPFGYTGDD